MANREGRQTKMEYIAKYVGDILFEGGENSMEDIKKEQI